MNNNHLEPWYGAKCIFVHYDLADNKNTKTYEERIVVFKAKNFDDAILQAETEAENYAKDCSNTKYVNFVNVFHIYDEVVKSGSEVYSLMRDSKLTPAKYLNRFYDTNKERAQK